MFAIKNVFILKKSLVLFLKLQKKSNAFVLRSFMNLAPLLFQILISMQIFSKAFGFQQK